MKTPNTLIATTLAVLALSTSGLALAHNGMGERPDGMGPMGHQMGMGPIGPMGGGMGPGMGMMHGGGRHGGPTAADVGSHLDGLKTQLQITPAQEGAWKAFEATVRQHAQTRDAQRESMRAAQQDPKAGTDWAARREQMQKLRDTQRAEHDAARNALYAVLTPAQKALADQHLGGGPGHRMGHGPMGRPMGQAPRAG